MFETKVRVTATFEEIMASIQEEFSKDYALEAVVQDRNHIRIQAKSSLLQKNTDPLQIDIYLKSAGEMTELTIADSGSSFILVFQIIAYMGTWIAAPAIALSTEGKVMIPYLLAALPAATIVIWLAGKFFTMRTKGIIKRIKSSLYYSVSING